MKVCTKCGESKPSSEYIKRRPECRSCRADYQRSYKEKRREELAAKQRDYYQGNRNTILAKRRTEGDQNRANVARWKRENPDKVLAQTNRRRARKKKASVFDIRPRELARLYNSPCVVCGTRHDITLDHIIPLDRGGRHSIGNLQAMCRFHNSMKGTLLMVEFRIYCWQHSDPMLLGIPFTPTSQGTATLATLL